MERTDPGRSVPEPPTPGTGPARVVPATVGLLVVVAGAARLGPRHTMLVAGPLGAALLLGLARLAGLGADELGTGRRSLRRGAVYAAWGIGAVAAAYAVAVVVPATRAAFLDQRYQADTGQALFEALVRIPLGTVLFEEVAFRGVLWGLLARWLGATSATVGSSVLFGLWHVTSALRLNQVNPVVGDLVGPGAGGQASAVAGAVGFTALAGVVLCELRRRSGSLLAPAGLHWATNGLGVLFSAGAAR